MLQWKWECRCLWEILISFPLHMYSDEGMLGHIVVLFLIFWKTSILFSIVIVPIYIPTNNAPGSLFSTSSPAFVISSFFFLSWMILMLLSFTFIYLFILLFLAVLGLCFCARAFSSCGEWGLLFVVVHGLLIAVASLVVEHGL